MRGLCTEDRGDLAQLGQLANLARQNGRTIVLATGVWDLFHSGHVRYLQDAARLGNTLFVGVDSDELVRRTKGPGRPVMGQEERRCVVAAMSEVDVAFIFDSMPPVMRVIRPDVLVISPTTTEHADLLSDRQTLAHEVGARLVSVPSRSAVHSSGIIRDIMARFGK